MLAAVGSYGTVDKGDDAENGTRSAHYTYQ